MCVKIFSLPHWLSSPQPGLGTLDKTQNCDTIGIKRWLKITVLWLFVVLAVNMKAFLMQEQGDCSPLTI